MKPILVFIPVFFVSLFVYTKIVGPIPFSVNQTTTNKIDLFTVSGTGKTSVTPDISRVTVGIQSQGATVKVSQDSMNTVINSVSDAIKKLGIDKKDIKTQSYSIHPTYDYTNGKQRITGFTAQTNLLITIRDLDKTNAVIDSATANGANTVSGVSFDIEDKTKAENEARELAIAEAKDKAENAAKIAGFHLGKILNYQENFNGAPQPREFFMAAKVDAISVPETQIEPGSQEVSITVTLSYELQ